MSKRKKEMKLQAPQRRNLVRCSKKNGFQRSLKQISRVRNTDKRLRLETYFIHPGSVCSEANAMSEFTNGKNWNEWKLDCLKQHLKQKVQLDPVIKSQNLQRVELYVFLPKHKMIES
jgi:hypothetical protein